MTQMTNSKFDKTNTPIMSKNTETSHTRMPPTQSVSFISLNTQRKECLDVIDICIIRYVGNWSERSAS